MKTIISTFLTIAVLASLYGCREQDEEETNVQIATSEVKNRAVQKIADSTKSADLMDTINVKSIIIPSDPPPKDRDQWKLKD